MYICVYISTEQEIKIPLIYVAMYVYSYFQFKIKIDWLAHKYMLLANYIDIYVARNTVINYARMLSAICGKL